MSMCSRAASVSRCRRDAAGLDGLAGRLAALSPRAVAVEATGGLDAVVVATLGAAGFPVVVVNPAQVRAFARALGRRAKTDPIDAAVIAGFATAPAVRPLPDAATRLLGGLVARRRHLVAMIVAERQRARHLSEPGLKRSVARILAALDAELKTLDKDLDDAVRSSPAWRERRISSPRCWAWGRRSPAPCSRSCRSWALWTGGRSPRWRASRRGRGSPASGAAGAFEAVPRTGGGRPSVRAALFLGAMVAARHNPALRDFRQRLLEAGKPKLVALVAVARNLLTILNAILRDRQPCKPLDEQDSR
jgi:transposase